MQAGGTVGATPAVNNVPPAAASATPVANTIAVPDNVSYATAESAFTAHNYPVAAAMFGAYVTRQPDNAWGHYMLGLSEWRAGQLEPAARAFEDALTRDPKHVKSLVNLSRVLLDQQRPADALHRINRAVALDSGLGEAWRVLGRAQGQLGHTDSAVDAYRTAIRIDSTDVWAMNDLGLTLIDAGRYTDALGRAVQLDSTVPVFGNNLGIALERSGHLTAAAVAYRGSLAADSTYAKARTSLQRVDGRPDAPGVDPVDVAALGAQFAQDAGGCGSAASP
jgi:tetratricopeptide (TPR) repeat protein